MAFSTLTSLFYGSSGGRISHVITFIITYVVTNVITYEITNIITYEITHVISYVIESIKILSSKQTNKRTDGRYQVHYLPPFAVDKNVITIENGPPELSYFSHLWNMGPLVKQVSFRFFIHRNKNIAQNIKDECFWASCILGTLNMMNNSNDYIRAGTEVVWNAPFPLWYFSINVLNRRAIKPIDLDPLQKKKFPTCHKGYCPSHAIMTNVPDAARDGW